MEENKDDIWYSEGAFTWKKKIGSGYHNVIKRGWIISYASELEQINKDIIAIGMTVARLGINDSTKVKDFRMMEITKSEFLGKRNK